MAEPTVKTIFSSNDTFQMDIQSQVRLVRRTLPNQEDGLDKMLEFS